MSDRDIKACVIGWPIAHSRSPLIHGYWLSQYGIAGRYDRVPVPPEELERFLKSLRANGYAGCNITVPHKQAALAVLDEVDADARRVKAVNTVWLDGDVLHGGNTDIHGFLANMDERAPGWDDPPRRAAILGAGGAARAVVAGLLDRRFTDIRVVNRTGANVEAMARDLLLPLRCTDWTEADAALKDASVLINATTLGMRGQAPLRIDLSPLAPWASVCDIIYTPLETELLRQARRRGLRAVDGLGMLLHQAAPGFERWFGVRPEVTNELRLIIISDIADK